VRSHLYLQPRDISPDLSLASNLPFSQITTGNWSVTIIGSNFTLERDFYLVAGPVETVTYTVTPTVIVGYTTTPIASSKASFPYKGHLPVLGEC